MLRYHKIEDMTLESRVLIFSLYSLVYSWIWCTIINLYCDLHHLCRFSFVSSHSSATVVASSASSQSGSLSLSTHRPHPHRPRLHRAPHRSSPPICSQWCHWLYTQRHHSCYVTSDTPRPHHRLPRTLHEGPAGHVAGGCSKRSGPHSRRQSCYRHLMCDAEECVSMSWSAEAWRVGLKGSDKSDAANATGDGVSGTNARRNVGFRAEAVGLLGCSKAGEISLLEGLPKASVVKRVAVGLGERRSHFLTAWSILVVAGNFTSATVAKTADIEAVTDVVNAVKQLICSA